MKPTPDMVRVWACMPQVRSFMHIYTSFLLHSNAHLQQSLMPYPTAVLTRHYQHQCTAAGKRLPLPPTVLFLDVQHSSLGKTCMATTPATAYQGMTVATCRSRQLC